LAALVFAGTGLAGCAPQPVVHGSPKEYQNLIFIAQAYIDATAGKQGPPKNLDQLKPFLQDVVQGIRDPDDVLVSPNDGLPYAIVWGEKLGRYPIAYEQKGKDGKRIVVDQRMLPWEVTDEQFARMKFPADHKPPGGS
jgi:hypothetical protein